jgi:hypothetical protein
MGLDSLSLVRFPHPRFDNIACEIRKCQARSESFFETPNSKALAIYRWVLGLKRLVLIGVEVTTPALSATSSLISAVFYIRVADCPFKVADCLFHL